MSLAATLLGLALLPLALGLLTGLLAVGLLTAALELLWLGYVLEPHPPAPATPPSPIIT